MKNLSVLERIPFKKESREREESAVGVENGERMRSFS